MKIKFSTYLILLLMLGSCGTASHSFSKKKYRRSATITTYSRMVNELETENLVLKENGYFEFYQIFWMVFTIKEADYIGRYSQKNDTLFLDWLHVNPKQVKYYLSGKCIINTSEKEVWFVDDATNERLRGLSVASRRF